MRSLVRVVFAVVVLSALPPRSVFAAPPDDRTENRSAGSMCSGYLPPNIDAGPIRQQAVEMLAVSDTFRRQCLQIAAAPMVRVTVSLITCGPESEPARTVIRRYEAGAIRAEVAIRFAGNYVELLAHELEHVLEQMERVDLMKEVQAGRAQLLPDRVFETTRAHRAGLAVWQEFTAAEPQRRNRSSLSARSRHEDAAPPGERRLGSSSASPSSPGPRQ